MLYVRLRHLKSIAPSTTPTEASRILSFAVTVAATRLGAGIIPIARPWLGTWGNYNVGAELQGIISGPKRLSLARDRRKAREVPTVS